MTCTLDLDYFRKRFPPLAAQTDEQIAAAWDMAQATISGEDNILLTGAARKQALYLMAAHWACLLSASTAGGESAGGVVSSVSEGSVSVNLAAPPFKSGWQYWLAQTPHGQALWALLSVQGAGGLYVGGSPERAAFRKAGGGFL